MLGLRREDDGAGFWEGGVMNLAKTCKDCAFCHSSVMSNNHGAKTCNRRSYFSNVHGRVVIGRTAEFERAWLWRKLGADTCGPEGRYWQARPPISDRKPPPPR